MKTFKQFLTESADLSKFITKRFDKSTGTDRWAFIDIHEPSKVFKWYDEKPSDDEIEKELRAIEYYKHS